MAGNGIKVTSNEEENAILSATSRMLDGNLALEALDNLHAAGYVITKKDQVDFHARKLNKELHRRLQQLEGPYQSIIAKQKNDKASSTHWALQSFDRMLQSFDVCQKIYQVCAPILGLPHDKFHSVMDSKFMKDTPYFAKLGDHEHGKIYANVYVGGTRGAESYEILDIVIAAIKKLEGKSDALPAPDGEGR